MKSVLQTAAVVALGVALALGYLQATRRKGYALQPGMSAPDFRLSVLQGGESQLRSYRGRVVLVNFWATWCPPCVAEMPSLERLHRTLGPEGLVVLAVSADEERSEVERFAAARGLTFPILHDPGGRVASGEYRTTGYPETFVIDRGGALVQHVVGPADWDDEQALGFFRRLLGPSSASAKLSEGARGPGSP